MFLGDIPRRRIGLVVDHPQRDLDGLCLVAQLLAERGHEAVLLPFYTQHFDLPNIPLDAIVLNYVRPANLALVRAAAARGIALVVLDTEGGLIPEDGPTSAKGIATFLRQSGLDRQIALYLFWGEHLRDHVTSGTALDASRAVVTGCPRFDLAQSRYRPAAEDERHVLVNANFPVANPAHGGACDDKALRSVGFDPDEIAELVEKVRAVLGRMIDTVRTIACERPERNFVVRPHPFESLVPYRDALGDFSNVRVERKGSAMEALAQAECVLHVNCTTAVDACLCAVPPISLDFINDPALAAMAPLPSQVSHRAANIEEALALIDGARDLSPDAASELVEPYFGPLDGEAAARVADLLASAPLPSSAAEDRQPLRRRLSAAMGAAIGSRSIESLRRRVAPARAVKRFTAADVRERLAQCARVHGREPARVEPIRTGLGLPVEALAISPSSPEQVHDLHELQRFEDTPHA